MPARLVVFALLFIAEACPRCKVTLTPDPPPASAPEANARTPAVAAYDATGAWVFARSRAKRAALLKCAMMDHLLQG